MAGRQLAGKVMLGNIFNLLQTWSDVNIRNFFTQLQQFFTNYKSPFIHVDGSKKWDLPYGEEQVDLLSYFEELSLSSFYE